MVQEAARHLEVSIAQDGMPESSAKTIERALEVGLRVPVRLTTVKAEDLVVSPHRGPKALYRNKLELYRKDMAEQMKGET